MTKYDKLNALIDHFSGGNKGLFAEMLGVKPNTVYNWVARNTFDAELIHKMCDGVNGDWLLSEDDGVSMLKGEIPHTQNDNSQASELLRMVYILNDQLREKDEQIRKLLDILSDNYQKRTDAISKLVSKMDKG